MKLPWRLSEDHLMRNALFLLLSSGTIGTFGFVFWLLAAHLFSSVNVGQAATVIAATTVISYVSDLGLTNTVIRYLPTSEDPDAEINTALILTTALAMVIATLYLLVAPSLVPNIRFLRENPLTAIGFVLLNGCAAANLLTDAVFIAKRNSQYNFVVDGFIQGVVKLGCLGAFVAFASYGIFLSNGIGAAAAVATSLVFMVWRLDYRPRLKVHLAVFLRTLHFSLTNYIGSVFQLLPLLFMPIIVVNGQGPRRAAYFFIAFNLANLTYAVAFSMGASLFAEGSQGTADIPGLARRAVKLLAPTTIAIAVVLAVASHWILKIYGIEYARHATPALLILLGALPIVALNNIGQILLKLRSRLIMMIVVNFSSFVVILGVAIAWSSKGLSWIALAWLLGNLIAALLAWAGWLVPPRAKPRHRMSPRQRRRVKRRRRETKRARTPLPVYGAKASATTREKPYARR
jgi:O-antigen/teichoic acid export membrane protein